MSTFVRVTKIFFNKMKKINSHTSFLFVFWVCFFFVFVFERENGRQIICWQSICLTVIFVFHFLDHLLDSFQPDFLLLR